MSLLPKDAKKLELENSTVDFYEYIKDGLTFYQFDTSECGPPEPMVNAMAGLQLLDNANKRLIMINHKPPMGLFPKIQKNYKQSALAIGNFDGIHLGHRAIISKLIEDAKKNDKQSAILSFNPHPRQFFARQQDQYQIISEKNKQNIFKIK